MNGVTIKHSDFMAYSTFEVHMNPNIYSNPSLFDPKGTLKVERKVGRRCFSGCHLCAGVKFVKLEIRLILALMLIGYNYELVNESGKFYLNLIEMILLW